MQNTTFNVFAYYNIETNKKMNEFIRTLSVDDWQKEFRGYFPSIESLANHIYLGDFLWLKRFSTFRDFQYSCHSVFDKNLTLNDRAFSTIDEYCEQRVILDTLFADFIGELKDEEAESNLVYQDSRGNTHSKNFGGLILHVFNHQTHHRGMISLYLEDLGIANDFCSLHSVL